MGRDRRRGRAQLVLAAAAVVAVALAPVVLAYLQLGYHADVRASADYEDPAADAVRALERVTHEATVGVPANHSWANRSGAVARVKARLAPRLRELEASRVESGTAVVVGYNATAARRRAAANCPRGPDRQFGPCEAHDGVVVQERAGEAHPLAVAYDLRVVTGRGRTTLTLVVRAVGGRASGS